MKALLKQKSFFFLLIILALIVVYTKGISPLFNSVFLVTEGLVIFSICYNTIISVLGLRRQKRLTIKEPASKFAIVVAAHNEEAVIGELVKNLKTLHYPNELYDVYVICDNCTDKTAKVVRENVAVAMERFNDKERGKGYALKWMFDQLWKLEEEGTSYDAVVVLDADNLVNQDFLSFMNTKLLEGYEVLQGYLDSKNPKDTLITKSYAISYWSNNRMRQLSRQNLGLSAQLGGTGFVVKTNVLKDLGWNATSLTEDVEFTQLYILHKGLPVCWVHEAIVYDEKPLTFIAAWRQKLRWMKGHADCMFRLTGPIMKQAILKRSLLHFDSALYLLSPSRIALNLVVWMFACLSFFNLRPSYSIWNIIVSNDTFSYFYLFLLLGIYGIPFIGLILERKYREIHWTIPTYFLNLLFIPLSILGIVNRHDKVWSHTKHTRSISIDEITKE
ncbi:glycosyltransferase family 2 protein [Neobacillus mesonae]|uniref:glycosyltransferase family 2 protein n=1 Tax=Neobacillus mesonae TaxID=1193713 RepID=UPI00082CC170|nr:glycosyltransferase family 2 protein [Neobacillus mesonae]